MTPINENLCGVWPVMLTPFRDDGTMDWSGLDALIEWYVSAGATGLFAVCLSSEMYKLTPEERVRLAKHVVQRAAGRVPVAVALPDDDERLMLENLRHLAREMKEMLP